MSLIDAYHYAKNRWSEGYALLSPVERSPLPRAKTIWEANALRQQLPYTGDPAWGLLDFYQPPGRLQWHLEYRSIDQIRIDCDDHALYAWATLVGGGFSPKLFALLDRGIKWSHVICLVGRESGVVSSICTNGLTLHDSMEAVLPKYSQIYPEARYTGLREITPPWGGLFEYKEN